MSFERFIAFRYIQGRRKEKFISLISLFSMAGVALGVMALIVVIGVMTGFVQDLQQKILSVNPHIILLKPGQSIADYRPLAAEVQGVPGVVAARPFIYTQVMISSGDRLTGGVIRGLDPEVIRQGGPATLEIKAGSFASLAETTEGPPPVVLGNELAHQLGVQVGDQVKIISPLGTLTGTGRMPRSRNFQVAAIVQSGLHEFDATLIFLGLDVVQHFLELGDRVTGLEIRVADMDQAPGLAGAIQAKLGPAFQTRDWMRMNRSLFAALKLQKTVLFIILVLIVLVAAFNITSSLIMLVMEKVKDIAILKSMGATRQSIMRIFVWDGVVIGLIGLGLGVFLSFAAQALLQRYEFIKLPGEVYNVTTLTIKIEALELGLIAGTALLLSFLATLYPAWRAARLDPVEAIRMG